MCGKNQLRFLKIMIKFSDLPKNLINEAKPFVVTIETKNGEKYRGKLYEAEDNMNIFLKNVVCQEKKGKIRKCEYIFLRGNNIKMIILPEILKELPVLKIFDRI